MKKHFRVFWLTSFYPPKEAQKRVRQMIGNRSFCSETRKRHRNCGYFLFSHVICSIVGELDACIHSGLVAPQQLRRRVVRNLLSSTRSCCCGSLHPSVFWNSKSSSSYCLNRSPSPSCTPLSSPASILLTADEETDFEIRL